MKTITKFIDERKVGEYLSDLQLAEAFCRMATLRGLSMAQFEFNVLYGKTPRSAAFDDEVERKRILAWIGELKPSGRLTTSQQKSFDCGEWPADRRVWKQQKMYQFKMRRIHLDLRRIQSAIVDSGL